MNHRSLPWKLRLGAAAAALLCLVLAADTWPGPDPASAQGGDEEYVDVAMALEFRDTADSNFGIFQNGSTLTVVVMNHGTLTAYDVEVVVDIVYPTNTVALGRPSDVPVGSVAMERPTPAGTVSHERGNGYSLRWTIPALPGLAYEELEVGTRTVDYLVTDQNNRIWDESKSPLEYYGAVTTSSVDLHEGNNTDRIWVDVISITDNYRTRPKPRYSIHSLSVDERHPSPGDLVTFTFVADPSAEIGLPGAGSHANIDSRVTIELTDGLAVDEDPDATPAREITTELTKLFGTGETPPPVSYSDGVFTIGTRRITQSIGTLTATVPVRVASDAVVNEQCITVTITGNPPPGPGPYFDDISDNVAKLCLGDQPAEPILSGQVDAFTVFPCVGITDAPCDSANDIRVRAVDVSGVPVAEGNALIKIDPLWARIYDGHMNSSNALQSVNDGNTVSWQTAVNLDRPYNGGLSSGIELYYSRLQFAGYESDWKRPVFGISARDVDGNTPPPGKVFLRSTFSGNEFRMAVAPDYEEVPSSLSTSAVTATKIHYFLEFEKMGTYKITWHTAANRPTLHGSEDCFPNGSNVNQAFCATETYTFHVGPMADLAVEDGGSSAHAPADRNALTIVAVNNGPDEPSGGARVTGLPTGAEVFHISQGSYDSGTGVWNIDELRVRGYYRSAGTTEPTLVLGATAGDTASVSIASTKDYEVCVGPKSNPGNLPHTTQTACEAVTDASWNSVPVYDYNAGNNTATITAARGRGGVGPGVPGSPRAQTGTTGVMWDPVEYLYGVPVSHYDIQWLGSVWLPLATGVTGNRYVDAAPSGRRDYRVRAVNAANVAGPWSRSTATVQAGFAGPPLNLRTQADGNSAIAVSWDAPEDAGGSAVTGYTVQWSADGSDGSWRNAGSTADQTFTQRGLPTGAIRYYRVAARNSSGLGAWSDPVMGQAVSGVPQAPTLTAKALSDYQIALTWTAPRDNGQPIERYRVDWSPDGSAGSWQRLAEVGADPTSYTDDTLPANTRRHYRVRAVNSVGGGAWSRTVSAITQLTPPDAPSLSGVAADGPHAIVVSWRAPYHLGDLAITQYQVQYAKNPYAEIWRGPATLSGSTRSWRHTGLQPDETWHYQVRASNGGGRWSAWSYSGSATTASSDAPRTVSGFSARYDRALDQVTLTWNASASDTDVRYELDRSEDGGEWRTLRSSPSCAAGTCAWADTDLWPGARLSYRVRAVSAEGEGPWSGRQSATRPPDAPDEPQVHWVEADGSNHIVIEWEPPYADGGAAVSGYRLLWCRALEGADENPCDVAPDENNPLADPPGYSAISLGASSRTYTHSVSPGYYYHYLLRATNGGNRWSEWREYDIRYARTYAGAPAAPGLTARAVDASQITLTWNKPSGYGSEITNYWLYVYANGDALYDFDNILDVHTLPGDATEWTIDGLSPGTTRYFRVRALNDNGEGKYSALRQATTPD